MACYKPKAAFRHPLGGPLAFHYRKGYAQMTIRCGNCIGCMIDDSRDWAARCMHEAKLHTHNCFLTLTISPEKLGTRIDLDHRDFQLAIKRLRESALQGGTSDGPQEHNPVLHSRHEQRAIIRYHMCGEYGPLNSRPHYHANMFGINFADKQPWKKTEAGFQLYKSETLEKIWQLGQCSIGQLSWQTAAYTARYNMKKAGEKNKKWEIINPETGEVITREPEYQKMSRNPGIGKDWIKQYKTDVYPRGTIIVNSKELTTPRFYDDYYRTLDEGAYAQLKLKRQNEQGKRPVDITNSRIRAEETVTRAKLAFLKRNGDFT